MRLSIIRRSGAMGVAIAFALAGGSAMAATAYGTLSNFDVYNDSTEHYHGFEIELEGIHKNSIPTYNLNGEIIPVVFRMPNGYLPSLFEIDNGTTFSTVIRYSGVDTSGTIFHSTAPFNYGSQQVATNGHSCLGISGCEHFGAGYYGNPTAVRYQWLKQDPNNAANLIAGPVVNLGNPVWNYVPPVAENQQPQVEVLEIDEPEQENENEDAPARWVKILVHKGHNANNVVHGADPNDPGLELQARLDALNSGHDDVVPQNDEDENGVEREVEWKLLSPLEQQQDPKALDISNNDVQVAQRYEFYEFVEDLVIGASLANCSHQQGSKEECDPESHPQLVGRLIGAQMAALNLDFVAPAPVPVPGALPLLFSAAAALGVIGRRRPRKA